MTAPIPEPTFYDVGDRDARDSGLFNTERGELSPGFPVGCDDIVVDVGCGSGNESLFCARQGAHVVYVDIDPEQVAVTGRRLADSGARALTPIVSDTNPLPLPDGFATKVIAAEVIEHVDDPRQFLGELVRIGRPGALYLLAVPDPVAEGLQKSLAPESHFEKPNHVRVIGREEFGRMVADAGLRIEERGSHGFYWAMWWIFFWICRVDLADPRHPLLESWSRTWSLLLDTSGGREIKDALNELMPKSQYIIARKPTDFGRLGTVKRAIASLLGSANKKQAISDRPGSTADSLRAIKAAVPHDPIDSRLVGLQDAAQSGWYKLDQRELFDGFHISTTDIVLDVGCGAGEHSVLCGKWGAHVIFTDIDAANVSLTERRLSETAARGATPIVGDANPLPIGDGTVSKIISTEVIEHVDDPAQFLKELTRVGMSGALYLLAVPDPVQEMLQRRLAPAAFFVKPGPGEGTIRGLSSGHLRTIGREAFEQLVEEAGLVVERHHYVSFYWALWFTLFWACDVDFSAPSHPLLASWARTWKFILDAPDGMRVKGPLDAFMPKSQIIIARKP